MTRVRVRRDGTPATPYDRALRRIINQERHRLDTELRRQRKAHERAKKRAIYKARHSLAGAERQAERLGLGQPREEDFKSMTPTDAAFYVLTTVSRMLSKPELTRVCKDGTIEPKPEAQPLFLSPEVYAHCYKLWFEVEGAAERAEAAEAEADQLEAILADEDAVKELAREVERQLEGLEEPA